MYLKRALLIDISYILYLSLFSNRSGASLIMILQWEVDWAEDCPSRAGFYETVRHDETGYSSVLLDATRYLKGQGKLERERLAVGKGQG